MQVLIDYVSVLGTVRLLANARLEYNVNSAYLQVIPKEAENLKSKEILCFHVHNEPLELTAVWCCGILSTLEIFSVLEVLYGTIYITNEQSLTDKNYLENL